MNEELETYSTTDLYLATYLMMRGKELLRVKKVGLKQSAFVFLGNCDDEVENFYTGEDKKFLEYAQTMKSLKSHMYAVMDNINETKKSDPDELVKGYRI